MFPSTKANCVRIVCRSRASHPMICRNSAPPSPFKGDNRASVVRPEQRLERRVAAEGGEPQVLVPGEGSAQVEQATGAGAL